MMCTDIISMRDARTPSFPVGQEIWRKGVVAVIFVEHLFHAAGCPERFLHIIPVISYSTMGQQHCAHIKESTEVPRSSITFP